jgi:hypothetical protein
VSFRGEGLGRFLRVAAVFMNWWAVGCRDSLKRSPQMRRQGVGALRLEECISIVARFAAVYVRP